MNSNVKKGLEKIAKHTEAQTNDLDVKDALSNTLKALRSNKPIERSEKARRYAVTITEMEKVYSYFKVYVVDNEID